MRTAIVGLCTAVFAIGAFEAATAADLPVKARPAPAATIDPWTGWYVGANVGWNGQRQCQTLTPQGLEPAGTLTFLAGLGNGCDQSSGVIGGGQVGVNQRVGSWVWGLEADISGLSGKTSRSNTGVSGGGNTFTVTENANTDVLATVRGRVGTLVDPATLVFATGGLAVGRVTESGGANSTTVPSPVFNSFGSATKWTPGWTVGAGVERKIGGNWSVKAEYLYTHLRAVDAHSQQDNVFWANNVEDYSVATEVHVVRVGVNYKLGGVPDARRAYASAAPVAYNWTGLYAGAHLGGAWGSSRATEPSQEFSPGSEYWNAYGDSFRAKTSGVVGGVQAGYNWQMNSIVAGVEGDLGYLGFRGSQHSQYSSLAVNTFVSGTGGLYGTFRGRLGVAWERALFYGTGGVIVADLGTGVNDDEALTDDTTGILNTAKTGTQVGWIAGGGVEYAMLADWSVKAEYLHFDFGSKQVFAEQENFPGMYYAFNIKNSGDMVRFGINRKVY